VSNFVTIDFPNTAQQPKRVYRATLIQEIFAHDYATIELRDWNVDPLNIKPGTLMTLTIKGKTYSGYVHDLKNNQTANSNFTRIGFIGASYVMKQASQKIYRNMSADQIVAEIAKKYNFAYKVTPHPRIYSQVAQAGMTDWELMVRLAKQSGYFLRAENTEIYFQPLTEDFTNLITEAVTFTKADGGFKPTNPIYEFKPVISETLRHFGFKKAATSVAGVDPVTGQTFKVTTQTSFNPSRQFSNQEFFDDHSTTAVANDFQTATQLAQASDEYSRFPYAVQAQTMGVSSIRPCLPVYFKNVGSEYTGYWTILSVTHTVVEENLNQQLYTCDITAASDSLGKASDIRVPEMPSMNPTRKLIPNQRNTTVKPKSIVALPSITTKRYQQTELVTRINRAAQTGPFVATARWASTHRDLNYKFNDERMPEAVWAKLRSNANGR
jgi:uncharacterized protein involved in type VI secretion and phage assembly